MIDWHKNYTTFLLPWQCFTNDNIMLISLIGWLIDCFSMISQKIPCIFRTGTSSTIKKIQINREESDNREDLWLSLEDMRDGLILGSHITMWSTRQWLITYLFIYYRYPYLPKIVQSKSLYLIYSICSIICFILFFVLIYRNKMH